MAAATDRPTPLVRAGAVAAAVLAALAVWVLAVPVLGITPAAAPIGGPVQVVGPVAVAVGPLCAGLSGWALLAVLERRVARPRRTWTVVALVVLVLSLVTPLLGGVSPAATGALVAMHVVAGGVLIALLPRRWRSRSR
ncbi:DUF6069 family protein [Pseudonocardia kunmingensis]|uniref:Uncharacterized protein n=1 Tax=Pseudonocardia kunmingensis TaxID=630975 RepID=A0A543E1G5_9PSEU|nr:DUF6069 family protein [Pseudonocardia kunmingensis]TQM15299.1 hypothetical protein FB558_2082 [Pseudonocardia kunmingensis]